MAEQNLYKNIARYYDLIYQAKDYQSESEALKYIIKKYKRSDGKELLDVACGTGQHLRYLKRDFNCTGIDLNPRMLEIAERKYPSLTFKRADMINFSMGKQYDVITCLFSSIGYVKTYANLKKTINNFVKHLKTGGVLIVEPWFTKKVFRDGHHHADLYKDDRIAIARVAYSKSHRNLGVIDMIYTISEKGKGLKQSKDRHVFGLFDTETTKKYLKEAGLKVKYLPDGIDGRKLFIGVKR